MLQTQAKQPDTLFDSFKRYLETLQPTVLNNLDIYTPDMSPDGCLYHITPISTDGLKYVPNMSRRAASREDNTVPRVTVAPTIMGCISGYATTKSLFDRVNDTSDVPKRHKYLGGLYINRLVFPYALSPNSQLVFDAHHSEEKWLVPFDGNHSTYSGALVGKIIPVRLETMPVGTRIANFETFYLEIFYDQTLSIDNKTKLSTGYYEFTYMEGIIDCNVFPTVANINPISREKYNSVKRINANLLSFKDPTKAFKKW